MDALGGSVQAKDAIAMTARTAGRAVEIDR